ncbi:unnamed protein product [Adineta ricciae]|uniref:G-protein coupled receptors family 1 profile domain-containing protein n=1 Tax=Adineta ricciae TaxID=249248 RepID=A0A815F4R5_ADIRI|nr:unnamed protein product [Adineta ricciae]
MSAQASSTVVTFKLVEKYLYQIGCPILIIIGIFGSVTNLLVFTQKNLRKSPCSIYFIANNLANFCYICSSLLPLTLGLGYKVDVTTSYLGLCRLRLYAVTLFNCLSAFYLVLASIDRVLITSRNATTRQKSTCRCACVCILVGTIFWSLFHIHALILSTISQIAPNTYLCYFQSGMHLIFMSYYSLCKELGALFLLTFFGLWSIRNLRHAQRLTHVEHFSKTKSIGATGSRSKFTKERQMMYMLFMDISIYALFSITFAAFLMYQQITQNQVKGSEQVAIESVVRNMCLFSAGIPFCLSCYTNLLVSKTFRSEGKKFFCI